MMEFEWRCQKCGAFTYHVLPPSQIKPFLLNWVIPEWEADRREFPDQPWTVEWLGLLSAMSFQLEEVALDRVRLRPDLMGYRTEQYDFMASLLARVEEREESLLRGVSTEPLLINRSGYELMDGYTRYMVMKKHGQETVLAYVGSVE